MELIKLVKRVSKKLVKRVVAGVLAIGIIVGVGAFVAEKVEASQEAKAYEAMMTIKTNQAKESGVTMITEEEAKQIALKAAEVTEGEVKYLEVKLSEDDDDYSNNSSQYVYEVEFTHDGLEYEFQIDGVEKTILHSEVEPRFE